MSRYVDGEDPWTYFGLYSNDQIKCVENLLKSIHVEYYFVETIETEERLKSWTAWDSSSAQSRKGYELWIHNRDLEKVGTKIIDMFPQKKSLQCRDEKGRE